MAVGYDNYYQSQNLFGAHFPELISFFSEFPLKGRVLGLGCGQGRDSIALARLGYDVTGIDTSKVGIAQMNLISERENLKLVGTVADIFLFDTYARFDVILFDSMFHFAKKDKKKEIALFKKIAGKIKNGCLIVFCIQDTAKKVEILNKTIDGEKQLKRLLHKKFIYSYVNKADGHTSETLYQMIIVKKVSS